MAASVSVVGDIIIISQAEALPSGFQLVEPPFVISETNEKRYLAYKKQTQAPNTLAVSDVVVCNDVTLVPPGYKTLNYTTPDSLESFPDKLVMIKKEGWSQALGGIPQAVTDIVLLRKSQRDEMPCGYKMTHDINGLCICIKRSDLKYFDDVYDDETEEDDVFGGALIGSDDDDFYEIPSSSGRAHKGSEEVDGCGMSKAKTNKSRRIIKSIPLDETDQNGDAMYPQVSQSIRLSPLYSNLHQLPSSFGFPLDQFLSPPHSTVLCSKCRNVLMNPYTLSCCNTYICENCLLHLQQGSSPKCPSCANRDYDFESSLAKRDEVDLLLLKCSNNSKGCKWRGQLGELDIHLFINCLYAEISCDSDTCRARFLRRDASNHKCGSAVHNNRQSLSYSRSASSVEELTHRISEIQKKQEETMSVVRKELRKFSNAKDNSDTESNYVKLGFEVRALKRQLAESLQKEQKLEATVKQQEQQLRLLKDTQDMFRVQFDNLIDQLQMKSLSPTPSQLLPMSPVPSPTTLKQPPCEFLIPQFTQYLRTPDAEWYSDPFLSDLHGYKMCLQVVPNGMMSSKGKDVSICVKMMRGEHDDQLTWPFQGKITVQILNWICDQRHATRVIDFNADARRFGACGRVPVGCPGDRAIKGWGILPFLPHGYIPLNKERNTEFMRNNRLCIRVVSITN